MYSNWRRCRTKVAFIAWIKSVGNVAWSGWCISIIPTPFGKEARSECSSLDSKTCFCDEKDLKEAKALIDELSSTR